MLLQLFTILNNIDFFFLLTRSVMEKPAVQNPVANAHAVVSPVKKSIELPFMRSTTKKRAFSVFIDWSHNTMKTTSAAALT